MMKRWKESSHEMVLCIFELVIGILLLIKPVGFTSGIIVAGGAVVLVMGVLNILKYFKTDAKKAAGELLLAKGLLAAALGGFCVFHVRWFLDTFPVLTTLYGVAILVTGFGKVQICVDMYRLKKSNWNIMAISAAVAVVCAVIILLSPFRSADLLWIFTGITLIAGAVLDVVNIALRCNDKKAAPASAANPAQAPAKLDPPAAPDDPARPQG